MEKRSGLLLGWCAALVVGTALFHSLGSGVLAAPPVSPAGWSEWAAGREPTVIGISLLRLLTLGLCWYLVGVTTVGLVARLLRRARLIRIADALTVPWVRRLLQQGLGVALATAMVTSAAGAAPAGGARLSGESPPSATMTLAAATPDVTPPPRDIATPPPLGAPWNGEGAVPRPDVQPQAGAGAGEVPTSRADPLSPAGPGEVPTSRADPLSPARADVATDGMVELQLPWQLFADDDEDTGTSTAPQTPSLVEVPLPVEITPEPQLPPPGETNQALEGAGGDEPAVASDGQVEFGSGAASAGEPSTGRGGLAYTVRAGDSLWRIAEQHLTRELDRVPSSAELMPYWRALIEANHTSLPDPDDPDLILPGQRLTVPPLLAGQTR